MADKEVQKLRRIAMADKEGNILAKDYGIGIMPPAQTFHVKGMGHAEWGMKTRLSQIFAADRRTIMLAFDHGYIMGSTAGLERLDLVIPPLMEYGAACLRTARLPQGDCFALHG